MNNKILTLVTAIVMASSAYVHAGNGAYDDIPFLPEWLNMLLFFIAIIVVPVVLVVLFVGMYKKVFSTLWYVISLQPLRRKRLREKLAGQMEYYRDIPASGNLKVSSNVMNSISSALVADYNGLFGALILRLIDKDMLRIEYKSNMYGAEPHTLLCVGESRPELSEVHEVSDVDSLKDDEETFEHRFFEMMKGAAGSDGILQPREMRQYFRTHPDDPFIASLRNLTASEKAAGNSKETAAQLLALKKFLLDFSLIAERDINEMTLWNEYLVYATLFGIADKVSNSLATIYPDYFKMNRMAGTRLTIVGNRSLVRYSNAAVEGLEESVKTVAITKPSKQK